MFHFYDGYHFLGMHLLWWLFWIPFVGVVFRAYTSRRKKDKPV